MYCCAGSGPVDSPVIGRLELAGPVPAAWRQDDSENGLEKVARRSAGKGAVSSPDPAGRANGAGPDIPDLGNEVTRKWNQLGMGDYVCRPDSDRCSSARAMVGKGVTAAVLTRAAASRDSPATLVEPVGAPVGR